jgi:hypothetical protein
VAVARGGEMTIWGGEGVGKGSKDEDGEENHAERVWVASRCKPGTR